MLLSGCELGPNFFSPAPPKTTRYTAAGERNLPPEGARSRAKKQHLAVGAKITADWWTVFHSPALDRVMKRTLTDSPSIAEAQAALVGAREQVAVTAGGLLPQVDLSAGLARQQFNAAPSGVHRIPVPVTVYSIGPTVSYPLDVFGGLKRGVEAKEAAADVSEYQLAAAYLSLTGNVAMQAITIAAVRAEIKTVERIIADDEKNLGLVKTAQQAGTGNLVDVTSAQSQLANDRTLLPPLRQRLSVARHALSVYAGQSPAEWSPPDFDLAELPLPHTLPVSLPSALVRQRPDILAAEAQLHVASANIGVATANLYPNITLNANVAQGATSLTNFFSGVYTGYGIGAALAAPIFHGGSLKAQQRAAYAAFDQAFATYRQTVVQAFGQVADSLQALVHDDEAVRSQAAAVAIANQAVNLARLSFQEGNSTLLQVLDAERLSDQAQIGLVRARSQRVLDTAQLFVALGSGWWNTPPTLPPPPPAAQASAAPPPAAPAAH
ncbi:MAG TPA: efflux transporter outer membrane subunit [Stellaceae bacterium]|nr:efflux transporter outer membrane subunit [Stellaceae bacterium]